jgi:hypothetical protein
MKKLGEITKFLEEIWWRNMWTRGLFVLIPLGIGIGLCELSGTATRVAGFGFIGLGIGFFWSGIGKSIKEGRKQVEEECSEREKSKGWS